MVEKLMARSEVAAVAERLKQAFDVVPCQRRQSATKDWRLGIWPCPGIPCVPVCEQLATLDRTKTGKLVDRESADALCGKFRDLLTQMRDDLRFVTVNQEDFRFWEILDVHARVLVATNARTEPRRADDPNEPATSRQTDGAPRRWLQ